MQEDVLGRSPKKKLSIAVVGPVYGGTVPIAQSVARTLKELNHLVHFFDFSSLELSYGQLLSYSSSRQSLEFLNSEFVNLLSNVVLEGIKDREIDLVIALAQAPLSVAALSEIRGRGIVTALWYLEDCRRFSAWKELARGYDFIFAIQKGEVLKWLKDAGAGHVSYLPAACDPEIHRPLELSAEEQERFGSAISFVGAGYHNRVRLFSTLPVENFKIWGTEWPLVLPFSKILQEAGRRVAPEEYVKIFNSSMINLNLHSSAERDGVEPGGDFVNPRTFELAASGAFQLVDRREYLADLFVLEEELATFSSRESLLQKIEYFQSHPQERKQIAEASRKRALLEHTYQHRLEKMIDIISEERGAQILNSANEGEWARILEKAKGEPQLWEILVRLREGGSRATLHELAAALPEGNRALSEGEQILLFMQKFMAQAEGVTD